jgi:mRNA interferase YafQ
MYTITTTNKFDKSLKLCKKRNYDLSLLQVVIDILQKEGKLPQKYKSHKLSGNYQDCWECHIKPDWLLVWKQNDTELILLLLDTGTHSDLF